MKHTRATALHAPLLATAALAFGLLASAPQAHATGWGAAEFRAFALADAIGSALQKNADAMCKSDVSIPVDEACRAPLRNALAWHQQARLELKNGSNDVAEATAHWQPKLAAAIAACDRHATGGSRPGINDTWEPAFSDVCPAAEAQWAQASLAVAWVLAERDAAPDLAVVAGAAAGGAPTSPQP